MSHDYLAWVGVAVGVAALWWIVFRTHRDRLGRDKLSRQLDRAAEHLRHLQNVNATGPRVCPACHSARTGSFCSACGRAMLPVRYRAVNDKE